MIGNTFNFKDLDKRRRDLGMSLTVLAKRSRVSIPTVHRILSGKHRMASFANVLAIVEALGMSVELAEVVGAQELREKQARQKAKRLVNQVQATSALEAQAVDPKELRRMVRQTTHELLAGSARQVWDEW